MEKYTIKLLITAFVMLIGLTTMAQQQVEEIAVPLTNPDNPGKLVVHLISGSISVTGYSGKEVLVNARSRSKRSSKQQFKNGMRRISSGSMEFRVEEVDNTVYIKKSGAGATVDFEIKVPRNFSLELKATNNGNIFVEGVNGEFEVSNTNGKIDMVDISGSVVADALNKNVTISFVKVKPGSNMAFSSLNGDLDITFPKGFKANVRAKSDNGNVYTDFDMTVQNNKPIIDRTNYSGVYKVKVEKWTSGTINGGGPEISFKTLNGDILIREQE